MTSVSDVAPHQDSMNDDKSAPSSSSMTDSTNAQQIRTSHSHKTFADHPLRTNEEVDEPMNGLAKECENTPPLPNGDKRLHPLFDEEEIASSQLTEQAENTTATSNGQNKSKPDTLRLLDSMGNEAGYPSPSGGFVPPVTNESWTLSAPPAPRSAQTSTSAKGDTDSAGPNGDENQRHARKASSSSAASSAARRHSSNVVIASDASTSESGSSALRAPQAAKWATFVHGEKGQAAARHSSATSSITSALNESAGHSQAISARSSPSTVAPNRRRSSGSADVLNMSGSGEHGRRYSASLIPLKVRDFAFTVLDPRHVGARDVGLPEPDHARPSGGGGAIGTSLGLGGGGGVHEWSTGADEYDDDDDDDADEEEFVEGSSTNAFNHSTLSSSSSGHSGLPPGLYHAAYDFAAESEHELDVKVGQRVRLIGHVDGGWAIVIRVREGSEDVAADDEKGEKGLVPEAYLEWLGQ